MLGPTSMTQKTTTSATNFCGKKIYKSLKNIPERQPGVTATYLLKDADKRKKEIISGGLFGHAVSHK